MKVLLSTQLPIEALVDITKSFFNVYLINKQAKSKWRRFRQIYYVKKL